MHIETYLQMLIKVNKYALKVSNMNSNGYPQIR